MNNICMLWHSKIMMFKLNIIGYFFSLSYMSMHDMLKRKNMQRKSKAKRIKMVFKYGCKHVSRRCENYKMYLESDNPHQAVMIVCELNWLSYISNRHNMRHLCTLAMFSHMTRIFFDTFYTCACTIWFGHHKGYMCKCVLTILF